MSAAITQPATAPLPAPNAQTCPFCLRAFPTTTSRLDHIRAAHLRKSENPK